MCVGENRKVSHLFLNPGRHLHQGRRYNIRSVHGSVSVGSTSPPQQEDGPAAPSTAGQATGGSPPNGDFVNVRTSRLAGKLDCGILLSTNQTQISYLLRTSVSPLLHPWTVVSGGMIPVVRAFRANVRARDKGLSELPANAPPAKASDPLEANSPQYSSKPHYFRVKSTAQFSTRNGSLPEQPFDDQLRRFCNGSVGKQVHCSIPLIPGEVYLTAPIEPAILTREINNLCEPNT